MTILVSASTGRLGELVIHELLERVPAGEIIAGARDPMKAIPYAKLGVAIRELDYSRRESAVSALDGVDRLLLISGNEPDRVTGHLAVIAAAKAQGVGHVAYTSMLHASHGQTRTAEDHALTEAALRESGLPFTLLRNGFYLENYTNNLLFTLKRGALVGASGGAKFSPAARADYAVAAAVALTTPGHAGKTYELAGDTAYSMAEIAAEITRVSGKPVRYEDKPPAEYQKMLEALGLPKLLAELLTDEEQGIWRGELLDTSGDLRRLLGRPTTSLGSVIEAALRAAYAVN